MLILYWYIGNQLIDKIDKEGWGAKVIEQLADDLQKAFPDMKGLSYRNLKYMRQFAAAFPDLLIGQQPAAQLTKHPVALVELAGKKQTGQLKGEKKGSKKIGQQPAAQIPSNSKTLITQQAAAQLNEVLQQPAAQFGKQTYFLSNPLLVGIPWGHHMYLLDKINDAAELNWYIQKTSENHWSRAVLQYQVETDLYRRQQKNKKSSNFHLTLPAPQADLANALLKDPYVFRFPQIGEFSTERQLEEHLIKHIQEFMLELGAGFAFVGRQAKLKAGRKEYFIDLLFYHLYLRSYVVIELKMEEFEMSHAGQMNGYLNIINRQLLQPGDNPSIGIILCAAKDSVEVDFALTNINHPIGVSEYTFSKTLPVKYRKRIPSARRLEAEVKAFMKKMKRRK